MLRNLKIIIALALAACAAAAYADPPGRVGRVNYASGAVSFAPGEASDQWSQAPLNRPLTAGDRLWADANGRAELHVGSMALRMGPQTSLDVLNLDDHTIQLRLAQGAVNVRVRELLADDTIEIATPSGAVLVKQPGSYRVIVDPRTDATRVVVNYGQAQVVTPAQMFTVPSSQAASFAAGAHPSFELATHATADDLDRWSAERDRREDRVVSTRYVSPQMTGYEDLDDHGTWRTLPEYGAVWVPARVASGWAPYRHGHWVWVSPWGWTWVDDAPWGFAPFHYGRWVWHDNYWAWAPGRIAARPVYAPALVAFVGGPSFSVTVTRGPAVGWFPLGWREPYFPSYRASPTYVRNVNVTHVTNVTNVTNNYNNSTNASRVRYVNRNNPQAVTVVPQQAFVSARPVAQARVNVAPTQLAKADVVQAKAPAEPVRASFASERPGQRPPSTAAAREVVAVTAPAQPAVQRSARHDDGASSARRAAHEPRVRVIERERSEVRAPQAADLRAPQAADLRAPQAADLRAPQAVQAQRALPAAAPSQQAVPAGAPAASAAASSTQRPAEARAVVPPPAQVTTVQIPIERRADAEAAPKGTPSQRQAGDRAVTEAQPKAPPPQSAIAVNAQEAALAKARAERREQNRSAPPEAGPKPAAETPRPSVERERREPRREPVSRTEPPANAGLSREQRAPQRADHVMPQRAVQSAPAARAEPPRAQAPRAESPRAQPPQQNPKSAQVTRERDARPRPERASPPREGAPQAATAPAVVSR